MRYRAEVTAEEPLPRLYGDFELARLICANDTGRIYRGYFRGYRASNVRIFSRLYTCDEPAVQTLRGDLRADLLMHPHITGGSCYPPFRVDQTVLQAMSPRPGVDLASRIAEDGPMRWAEARTLLLDVCRGLAYAHAKLVVHGDLKPENIFCQDERDIDTRPLTLVMGFGLARAYRRAFGVWRPEDAKSGAPARAFPIYMAPEQAMGEQPTVLSDIYALGVLMLHLLAGAPPRASSSAPTIARVGASEVYRSETGSHLALPLADVAFKATSRESARRYASVIEFATALVEVDGGDPEKELADMRPPVPR